MVTFFETKFYWQGGFTKDQQKIYKGHRLSQKGKQLWNLINKVNLYAGDLSFLYDIKCCYGKRTPHLPSQCEHNDNETLPSYVKDDYDFYDVDQIEEFIAFKGAYEIASLLENIDDASYKSENFAILKYCFENYNDNGYITEYIERVSPAKKETNVLQEPMEEEFAETESSLDEKEEESERLSWFYHDRSLVRPTRVSR